MRAFIIFALVAGVVFVYLRQKSNDTQPADAKPADAKAAPAKADAPKK